MLALCIWLYLKKKKDSTSWKQTTAIKYFCKLIFRKQHKPGGVERTRRRDVDIQISVLMTGIIAFIKYRNLFEFAWAALNPQLNITLNDFYLSGQKKWKNPVHGEKTHFSWLGQAINRQTSIIIPTLIENWLYVRHCAKHLYVHL